MGSSSSYIGELKRLALTMFKVGLVGFGGGSALIPVLHQEAVEDRKLVSEDSFNKDVVVATITPGALPVEIAAGIGREIAGVFGMLVGAGSIALPGVLIVVLACSILSSLGDLLTTQVNYLAIGVSGYIIAVLSYYVISTMREQHQKGTWKSALAIVLLIFALTCGKHVLRLLEADMSVKPLFGISTVEVMMTVLFVIFWTQGKRNPSKIVSAFVIALLYCLSLGGISSFFDVLWLRMILRIAMVIMAFWGIRQSLRECQSEAQVSLKPTIKEAAVSVGVLIVAFGLAWFFGSEALQYLSQGCVSSVLSFGGGDAYLSVASGVFVASGLVSYQWFYSLLVPAANASPGSILCEVFSGCGYFVGLGITGSIWGGFLLALCGFMCSIVMSCLTFSLVAYFYERFENLSILSSLKRLIRPIISGLLLTVVLSFAYNCMSVSKGAGWPGFAGIAICLILAVANGVLARNAQVKPLRLVLGSALVSLAVCNVIGFVL